MDALTSYSNGNSAHWRKVIHCKYVRELLTMDYTTIIALLAGWQSPFLHEIRIKDARLRMCTHEIDQDGAPPGWHNVSNKGRISRLLVPYSISCLGQGHASSLRYREERYTSSRSGGWSTTFSLKVSLPPVPGSLRPVLVIRIDCLRSTPRSPQGAMTPFQTISPINHSI